MTFNGIATHVCMGELAAASWLPHPSNNGAAPHWAGVAYAVLMPSLEKVRRCQLPQLRRRLSGAVAGQQRHATSRPRAPRCAGRSRSR